MQNNVFYTYDKITKKFQEKQYSQIDPLETIKEGHTIYCGLPTNATYEEPLDEKEGFDIIMGDNGWEYVEQIKPAPEPEPHEPTYEEIKQIRADLYQAEVDPITSHISRLRDKEQTPEIQAEIEQLMDERDAKVEEIKERYPYPEGE